MVRRRAGLVLYALAAGLALAPLAWGQPTPWWATGTAYLLCMCGYGCLWGDD